MTVPFPWLPNALYLVFPIVFLVLLVCGRHCFSPEHSFQALNDSKSSILPDTPSPVSPSSSASTSESTESPLPSPEMQKQKADAYIDRTLVKQTYDAFLVLDVEATCVQGADFNYPNEIIEWPVVLLKWKDKDSSGKANRLEVIDEFRSFVKPVWRPQLSAFCTSLTGITQEDVNDAPYFYTLTESFKAFMIHHGLIDPVSGNPLMRYCWCTDGPWDIRDFVVKQCFISKMQLPIWLAGDVMDVRRTVARWQDKFDIHRKSKPQSTFQPQGTFLPITRQLYLLGLSPFEGRQHCGIDDTRNIARIVIELARRGVRLKPNTPINPNRRWPWMGKYGKILEHFVYNGTAGYASEHPPARHVL